MITEQRPKRHGCLFWGAIVALFLFLCTLFAGYGAYRYLRHLVFEYTDSKPIEMPVVQLSGTEVTNLQQRVEKFNKALEANKPVDPLILSADEINALIANETKTNPVPVHLYFSFNQDRVQAQLSLPTDGFPLRILKGRYFNGSGDFAVSVHDDKLFLNIKSLSIKGKPLPERFMQPLRQENFADSWTNDPDFNNALAKLKELKIESNKLYVIPKVVDQTGTNVNLESGK